MSFLQSKFVNFDIEIASHPQSDLKVFKPDLPAGWYYLGPVATSDQVTSQQGLVFKELIRGAFADIVDWQKVGPNNGVEPPPPFSTWRGVAPDGYTVVGDFFVNGNNKPTADQTAGLKAIRKDLVHNFQPQRLIWEGRQPRSVVTLWDVVAVPLLYIATGAFISNDKTSPDGVTLAVVRFNAWCVSSTCSKLPAKE